PLDLLAGAVALRLLAHKEQRQAGLHRHGAAKQHRAELWRGEALRLFRHERRQLLAQLLEQRGFGLEQELVEVAVRLLARAKHEFALEVRRAHDLALQRLAPPDHLVNLTDRRLTEKSQNSPLHAQLWAKSCEKGA